MPDLYAVALVTLAFTLLNTAGVAALVTMAILRSSDGCPPTPNAARISERKDVH